MPLRQTQKLQKIHAEMRQEFDRIQEALANERQQCIDDRRFYSISGAQWEGKYGEQFKNKPRFEVNKIHLSVIRIFNEYRNNRITVDFISKEGVEDDALANTCDNLYRADEQDSSAEEAYDNGFEEAVGGGFGAFRLRAEYEDEYDEENERQRILIEPIYDADTSVFFDLDAKKYDKSDAKYCFVLSSYTPESMEREWNENVATWPKEIMSTTYFDWATPDVVYVAEVYVVEEVKETIFIYKTIDGDEEKYKEQDFNNDEELEARLQAIGTTFERERKVKTRRVHKYIMSGNQILEDCGYIAGKNIPIIPIYGKRWFVDNVERCMGHVRLAKDVQRLKNMQMSKLAEISALSTVEKPILTPEQVAGHQIMWQDDNIKNYPYLLINPVSDINGNEIPTPPLAYTKVPNIPPAMAALLQLTDADMKEILGNQEAGEQIKPNLSGKAIELIQSRLDMQTFIYMSNMAKSIKRSGEVWLSMAQDLFVESGRKMKGIVKDGGVTSIELLKPRMNQDNKIEYDNDLSKVSYDVVASVGPSSSSKRQSIVRSIISMLPLAQDPETVQILTGMALMNMEGEGIEDARQYFRDKLLRMGVIQPTEEEAKKLTAELQNQQPDPQTLALQGMAEEAQAKAAQARANTVKTVAESEETQAKTEKTKAETMETLSKIQREEQLTAIDAAKALGQFTSEQ
jgi:hypothetical protein